MREDQNVVGSREKVILLSPHQQHTHTHNSTYSGLFFFLTKCQDWIFGGPPPLHTMTPLATFSHLGFVGQTNFFSLFFFLSSLWTEQRFRETLWKIKKKNEEKKEAQPIPSPGLFVLSSDTKTLWKKKRSKANSLNEKMRHAKCERKGGGSNHFSSPPPKSPHRPCVLWDLLRRLAFFFFSPCNPHHWSRPSLRHLEKKNQGQFVRHEKGGRAATSVFLSPPSS